MQLVDPPWELAHLCQELQTPSLFAGERLFLIPHAEAYFALPPKAVEGLLATLKTSPAGVLWVGLFAELPEAPSGPLAEGLASLGEVEHLSLPPAPKPWEEVRLSQEQKALLRELLAEEAPELLAHQDVLDVLFETHGFSPRQLVQAAKDLLASQELSPEAARRSAGRQTLTASELEKALQDGKWPQVAYHLAQLAEGAVLSTFRGTETSGRKAADLVAGLLTRACLSALTVRVLAEEAGLARELDPARVSQASWYPREFKPRIYPKFLAKAQEMPELGLADRSPWSLQASFRLAARFSSKKLATVVADLLRFGALRAEGLEPWAPVVLAYASLFAASNSS
ncbi:hypothetical protein EG19_04370 [Thermoanaerobaculum aquaticum]|uniref:Uncharacterized protein n=1 Tax=Thermoanaerobaculum aquaticum TaxID=1312852 RepID=A0A062XR10_9BACT|nr:hypothetical protein [Thermoanaerobaculum aquaticum]KDA55037.1 hypothetical protein EG19_04370 [Thermoanaerobaculum aquaticum]